MGLYDLNHWESDMFVIHSDGYACVYKLFVCFSTHTFIGSSLIEDMEGPSWESEYDVFTIN